MTDSKYPDAATEEIAKAMEADGIDTSQLEGKQPKEPEVQTEEEKAQAEADAKAKADADAAAAAEATLTPEQKAQKEAEEKGKKEEKAKREPRQVLLPIARVKQAEKKLRDEYEAKIADLNNQVRTLQEAKGEGSQAKKDNAVAALTAIANDIATKHNSDPELVRDILEKAQELTKTGTEIPAELKDAIAKVQAISQEQEEQRETAAILTQFDDEFQSSITADKDVVAEIRASGLTLEQFKDRLQEIVLGEDGERYAKLTLREVLDLKKADLLPKRAKSADASRGRTTNGTSAPSGTKTMPTKEEMDSMSDEEFEKVSEELGSSSKSHITRRGRPIP